mmetsp:Transcript_8540/g.23101  ORF Transcript_8540/g.23101 Transcript_8540/m.23101 type:complete len:288 (+) Transcript_8540:618-1481(+)
MKHRWTDRSSRRPAWFSAGTVASTSENWTSLWGSTMPCCTRFSTTRVIPRHMSSFRAFTSTCLAALQYETSICSTLWEAWASSTLPCLLPTAQSSLSPPLKSNASLGSEGPYAKPSSSSPKSPARSGFPPLPCRLTSPRPPRPTPRRIAMYSFLRLYFPSVEMEYLKSSGRSVLESSGAVVFFSARFRRLDVSSSMRGGSSMSVRIVKSKGSGTLRALELPLDVCDTFFCGPPTPSAAVILYFQCDAPVHDMFLALSRFSLESPPARTNQWIASSPSASSSASYGTR